MDRDDEQRHTSPGAAGVSEGAEPPVLTFTEIAARKGSYFCGGERTRTAVQTSRQAAFYMLILPLVFVMSLPEGGRTHP